MVGGGANINYFVIGVFDKFGAHELSILLSISKCLLLSGLII